MTDKVQLPSPHVAWFTVDPTGQVTFTVEGLKHFRQVADKLAELENRVEALEP